jgi:predicted amidohydrolase
MPRKISVATVCTQGYVGPTPEKNRERALSHLDEACALHPDIVCLPETFASVGASLPVAEKAEPVPGPSVDACARRAREHGTYVVCPIMTVREGRVYNSAVIIDRAGDVAGIYDKVQPVTSTHDFTEMENGVMPGAEAQVFDLDFGRVGVQICFDMGFPEAWQQLADRGAELVLYPSAVPGGFYLRSYAFLHEYFVVSSVRSQYARIINPMGDILAETSKHQRVVARQIDLDYIVCHFDFHPHMPDHLQRKYGNDITVRAHQQEGRFVVWSNSDDVPLDGLVQEEGLEAVQDYYGRHRSAYAALREGRTPEPQSPPYGDRPQWA